MTEFGGSPLRDVRGGWVGKERSVQRNVSSRDFKVSSYIHVKCYLVQVPWDKRNDITFADGVD